MRVVVSVGICLYEEDEGDYSPSVHVSARGQASILAIALTFWESGRIQTSEFSDSFVPFYFLFWLLIPQETRSR